ncbi:protein SEMI-ROLLED LEAF 2-like [Hibiscus syriacus]|uniref:protein SEMI-ROLLED LEAF 2-like n=1 Tax=Hibiscus syriacus TaxID=106335 RepID=UPI0019220A3F|nr:protein SEMI-ROLLED LEAF 2-like [Hibiscus syriacus]
MSLFDFVISQKDGTFMSNLEGFIPKFCQLSQEIGEDERETNLRSVGLQAISSLIWLMAEHSHISVEFYHIVSVVLENYGVPKKNLEDLCWPKLDGCKKCKERRVVSLRQIKFAADQYLLDDLKRICEYSIAQG